MNDDAKLSELLGSLPREKASPYFTVGVLRRLRDAQGRRRLQPIERFVAAAAALVASTAIAVAAGSTLSNYVNTRHLSILAGAGFIVIGAWTLWSALRAG